MRKTMSGDACVDAELMAYARDVLDLLKKKKKSIITAESCTGGLISAVLSQCDGAGEVLHGGFVTYTKANKTLALGVRQDCSRRVRSSSAARLRILPAPATRIRPCRKRCAKPRSPWTSVRSIYER
jgi:hypothetical protein